LMTDRYEPSGSVSMNRELDARAQPPRQTAPVVRYCAQSSKPKNLRSASPASRRRPPASNLAASFGHHRRYAERSGDDPVGAAFTRTDRMNLRKRPAHASSIFPNSFRLASESGTSIWSPSISMSRHDRNYAPEHLVWGQ
jgi:hypothetical protein